MTVAPPISLAELTSLRIGGPARTYLRASSEAEFIDAVRTADDAGEPVLVIGGGTNMLVSDAGFPGLVVHDARSGISIASDDLCGGANVTAVAGNTWDDLVAAAVAEHWVGIEAMSGIPGTVGAAPVQNIGAYGQEIARTVASVRTWDRLRKRVRTFTGGELEFSYRTSRLKESMFAAPSERDPLAPWRPSPRYVVLDVSLHLRIGRLSAPVVWDELAHLIGISVGSRAPSECVREAVLELRANKGTLIDGFRGRALGDHDRWSAGSFFTNPILTPAQAARLPADAPLFPVKPEEAPGGAEGLVKAPAAWLIEQAGFGKGYSVPGGSGRATLSNRHTLAITNRGGATAADVVELARAVRAGVAEKFGITLENEPVLVGVSI